MKQSLKNYLDIIRQKGIIKKLTNLLQAVSNLIHYSINISYLIFIQYVFWQISFKFLPLCNLHHTLLLDVDYKLLPDSCNTFSHNYKSHWPLNSHHKITIMSINSFLRNLVNGIPVITLYFCLIFYFLNHHYFLYTPKKIHIM